MLAHPFPPDPVLLALAHLVLLFSLQEPSLLSSLSSLLFLLFGQLLLEGEDLLMLFLQFSLVQGLLAVQLLQVDVVVETASLNGFHLFLIGGRVRVEIAFGGSYLGQKG